MDCHSSCAPVFGYGDFNASFVFCFFFMYCTMQMANTLQYVDTMFDCLSMLNTVLVQCVTDEQNSKQ